jgi:hypothetical protein
MNAKQFLAVTLGSALLLSPALLEARPGQEQAQESVADAARKAQAAKKTAPKAKRVIDNDNLDTIKGSISIVGQQPAPPVVQTKAVAAADDKTKAAAPPDDKKPPVQDEAYWRKAFADANKKLADDAHELDVDQRDYNLKQQQYYSDPNTAMKEQYNRQELTDAKKSIDDKTAAIEQDKQDISDLEDALRKTNGDPGWASSPSATQPQ